MASAIDILREGFTHVADTVHAAVQGLDEDALATQVEEPGTNSIAWLVWHLTRVQDDHVADVADTEQVWTSGGWHERFGLPFDTAAIGYGFSTSQMAQVRGLGAGLLTGYYDAVHAATLRYLTTVTEDGLDRVVDENWDPPVTLAVRLVSVLNDDLQHAGQAAFVRGVLDRR
ncbi:DUF664 domain-containing protein [uncultured Jatrophihabitans sp.]|uniref:mycothiol transferase n=1 Tax=uncultured Jatrophihabitans sp. TaxID=1610747 RepID=UPI0035CBA4E4